MKLQIQSKRFLTLFLVMGILLSSMIPPTSYAAQNLELEVKSAILVEVSTGKVIYELNADEPLPPASMTKMMTEYLVLEAIRNGSISWDDVVTTSDYGYYLGRVGGSRVYLGNGEKRTVRELFSAMAIYSANDATAMLAEYIAGTETSFVELMNKKAKEFGMKNTNFLTSSGFPVEELGEFRPNIEGEHYMSARDSAILGRRLIMDYPEITEFTTQAVAYFREETSNPLRMDNWNMLIPGRKYAYPGADGLKTGSTAAAGYSLTATAERNGIRLVSVVMRAETEDKRFQETTKLLDYGFNNYELLQLAPAGVPITGQEVVTVSKGKETEVTIVPESPYTTMVRKGEENLYEPKVTTDPALLAAPLEKGKAVGNLIFEYKGTDVYSYLTPEDEQKANMSMVTETEVEKASWIRLFFRAIKNMVVGVFSGISDSVSGWFS